MKRGFSVVAVLSFLFAQGSIHAQEAKLAPTLPQTLPPTLSAAQLQALSGEYTDPETPDLPTSFYAKDGKLFIETERTVPAELTAVSPTEFVPPEHRSKAHYTFWLDAFGKASSLSLSYEGRSEKTTLPRIGDAVHHTFPPYERQEVMIPMRDGVKLHAVILKPVDSPGPLPFLMERTPYGVDEISMRSFYAARPELARALYIYVAEDIRGRFKSEGQFVMNHPLADRADSKATDESTDSYDTVAWLLVNVSGNNGRVGVVGTSYPGFLAMMAGIDPHPAVKAVSPQAPMIDTWMGDDFFHNGAFRQTYGYDYAILLETGKDNAEVSYGKTAAGDSNDGYDYFLQRGSFAEDVKQSGAHTPEGAMLPTWKAFFDHTAYDEFWSSKGVEHRLNTVAVPTLSVGGYYDQEDMWGPQAEYDALEPHDSGQQNFLVLGPWRHGSWSSSSRHLGAIQYGEPIGTEFRKQIEAPFFAHYLKEELGFDLKDTASFQTGSNVWKRYAHFPPAESAATKLYVEAGRKLGWQANAAPAKFTYISDPSDPVPYRHRPNQPTYGPGSNWGLWMTEDQRFVTGRKDVAVWTLPLDRDLTVTGEVMADIFVAIQGEHGAGSDGDLVVKLIDQYPEDDADPAMRGYQLMTNEEIFRGRYLSAYDKPAPLKPGEPAEFKYSLHAVDHVFKRGHTLMVEVQSTWFPLYDRNPQTYVPNIMNAKPGDYRKAEVTILSDAAHPSGIVLPVVAGAN